MLLNVLQKCLLGSHQYCGDKSILLTMLLWRFHDHRMLLRHHLSQKKIPSNLCDQGKAHVRLSPTQISQWKIETSVVCKPVDSSSGMKFLFGNYQGASSVRRFPFEGSGGAAKGTWNSAMHFTRLSCWMWAQLCSRHPRSLNRKKPPLPTGYGDGGRT